ncbi:MAG: superoxide dismutase [Candidatus Gracilibacteria bacterium]|nr:superoxide dismutase [Candidatus Gracilibacteria bacterium]
MQYSLPKLTYDYNDLEPYIDAKTLEIHHTKHHAGYVTGANNTIKKLEKARQIGDFSDIKSLKKELAFHLSGHILHSLYWKNMTPNKTELPLDLKDKIKEDFGNLEMFEKEFKTACTVVEGSGWGAVVLTPEGHLEIITIEKHQDLNVMGSYLLLVCDVWEHAYYLQYKNDRAKYIDNFWKIINWNTVNERFKKYEKTL